MELEQNEHLLCCRVCLLTDCKLLNIHEYKLADTLADVSGTPVSKDGYPQYLCLYCYSLLLKCASFRAMCRRTQQVLTPELLKGKMNIDGIRKLDGLSHRLVNLNLSVVQIVYCGVPPAKDIKSEPDDTDESNIDETKINNDDIEIGFNNEDSDVSDDKDTVRDDIVTKDDINGKIEKKNGYIEKQDISVNNEDSDDSDDKDTVRDDIVTKDDINGKVEKKKSYIEKQDISGNNEDIVAVKNLRLRKRPVTIVVTMRKTVDIEKITTQIKRQKLQFETDDNTKLAKVKRVRPRKEGTKEKKEKKRMSRDPTNDNLPVFDFSKFETDYGVQIVTLSKQEQLEEIAARKQSVNYKESRFRCEDCGKGFDMEAAYNNHLLRHNPNAGQYSCEICSVRFKRRCLQNRHQDLHRLKFVCKECGFVSRLRPSTSTHQEFVCKECGFLSRQGCNAKLHFEVHQGRRFICEHCGKTYSKRSSHLSHVRLSHPAMNVACDACGETFVGQTGLAMHKKFSHSENASPQKFNCVTCSANFVSLDALNRHTDSGDHTGRPCEQCGESCASEDALQAHVGAKHPKESHRCEECRATFPSASVFELHYRRKHLGEAGVSARAGAGAGAGAGAVKRTRKKSRANPRRSRKQFVCETCGHISPNAAVLRYHQNIHLAVKPFACPECPKTFTTNAMRNWHVRKHSGEKPFKCSLCPLAFTEKQNYKRHHKTVHLGLRENVPCSICGRVFTTKSSLRLHVNYVHNGQPWPKRDRTKTKKVR